MYEIHNRLGVPSVKKSRGIRTDVETRQAVVDIKESDVAGDVHIPRDELRKILHDEFGEEFENRFVGKKKTDKIRIPLKAFGPYHQEHSDGHEKMSEQGLNIGAGITLPIYASKDQFCSFVHALLIMPNVRNGHAIAHYYLDLVEKRGFIISIQLTTDMGNEVNEAHKIHAELRDEVAPEYAPPQWPHGVKQSSTKNTPIEGFWRWLRAGSGHSTKAILQEGAATGIFIPNDNIHRQTLYWLWNNHKLQKSKGKMNASGSSPLNILINPTSVVATACDCSIKVNPASVYRLREAYGGQEARDKAFRCISREFEAEANAVYVDLGCPPMTLVIGWGVFKQVVAELQLRVQLL
ncbi:hypothetical protein C8J57DRAFT_1210631 [Mycena rebaudengoi]|nr:hypothetical protein C8J57DRAFT_1210630 [Mycena rebaudengoi]KAJ7292951.1 hypothetical protein C8J57DRAFT_1210631 [Mycena rebaudengoi]